MIDRLHELAARSWELAEGVDSDFLTPEEYSEFLLHRASFSYAEPQILDADHERQLLHFGDGKPEVTILRIRSLAGDHVPLKHSDYLGAILGLGIERRMIGDIVVHGTEAYVYTKSSIAEFICRELLQVGRASVELLVVDRLPEEAKPQRITEEHVLSSLRLDRFIATVFRMSRGKAAEAIAEGLIYIDGRQESKIHMHLEPGQRVSFRRRGKVRFQAIKGETRKGSQILLVERFI